MKRIISLLIFSALCVTAIAQVDTSSNNNNDNESKITKSVPAQFSLFYPIGTSGKNSRNYRYNLSINLLYGRTGGLNGIELSGLAGVIEGDVRGIQIGGLGSLSGNVTGIQIGGLGSLTADINGFQIGGLLTGASNLRGIQVSGLIGLANDINGIQISGLIGLGNNIKGIKATGILGIANNVRGIHLTGILGMANNIKGMQLSGIANISNDVRGIQFNGIGGIANNVNGLQFSDIANIANEINGAQIAGVFNRARTVRGFQFALVNITDTISKGIPVGIVSIVKRGGYSQWELSSSDIVNIGLSYKLGIRKFYSIYSVGYNFFKDRLFVAGFGFGSNIPISADNKYEFQPELINYTYVPTNFRNIRYTSATQLRLGFVHNFNKVGLLLAPTVYVATMHEKDGVFGHRISPISPIYTNTCSNNKLAIGIGYTVGITLR